MDISKLLEAQKIDKKRIDLLMSIEKGDVKNDLDNASQTVKNSKTALLTLEAEAKDVRANFDRLEKVLKETLKSVEEAKKDKDGDVGNLGSLLSRVSILEGQLSEMAKRIAEKVAAFKNTTIAAMQASEVVKKKTEMFEKQKAGLADQVKVLEKEFEAKVKDINEKLVSKYKAIRKQKNEDSKDVVVPIVDERCGGCYMEMPRAIISKVDAEGWGICEECRRIVFKNADAK